MIASEELNFLTGFENNQKEGYGEKFNFVLSNDARSTQRDVRDPTNFTHMIPAEALNKIRSVTIHYWGTIIGFSFFDKDGALLWKIGGTASVLKKETVEIAENERIIGVKAKLDPKWQSCYTDWQFQIGKFVWRCD